MFSRKAVGIVAEYNPFHKGHLYHIEETRRISCADVTVVVLSSDFVQRGEPALLTKWQRAQAAVLCGADIVLELPVVFSSHNAGVFASAAVDILHSAGVESISCGAESGKRNLFDIADILIDETQSFKQSLKKNLGMGLSYVQARAEALDNELPGIGEFMKGSNNILALSYAERIRKMKYSTKIIPVKRKSSAHNSTGTEYEFASSTAIRAALSGGKDVSSLLPEASAEILKHELENGTAYTSSEKYWTALRAALLRASERELANSAEISEGIEYKMKKEALRAESFEQWTEACTSKRYPRGRIRRSAAHFLLGLNQQTNREFQKNGPAYLRILAMNKKGREYAKEMKENSLLPIVSRLGDAARISDYAARMMSFDMLAGELRRQFTPNGFLGIEHKMKPYLP